MATDPNDNNQFKKSNERVQAYMRFSALGLQMMGIILAGVFGGYYIDKGLEWEFPFFTLLLSMLGIGAAMYFLFKETGRKH